MRGLNFNKKIKKNLNTLSTCEKVFRLFELINFLLLM
ncbi:hypothetical protein Q604_UNBC05404G0001, partial [human gut metagenome]